MADYVYNAARHKSGDPKAVRIPATVTEEIKAGDFVVLVSSKASPAAALSDAGTKAQNQEAAHDIFLGVALDAKLDNDTRDILVATEGVFEYPCAALGAAKDIGTLFGMAGTGSAGAVGVANQEVEEVATANLAIGKLAENAASGATTVKIRISGVLTTNYGGCQAAA